MLVLAEEDSLTATGGVGIPALVPELKKADSSESLLSTMIKINDAVDADEEGLLENTIEREVRSMDHVNGTNMLIILLLRVTEHEFAVMIHEEIYV